MDKLSIFVQNLNKIMKKFYITAIVATGLSTSFAQVTIENTIENKKIMELSSKMIAEVNLLNSGMLSDQEKQIFELKIISRSVEMTQSLARYEEGKSVRELTDKLEFDFVVNENGSIRETTTGLDVDNFILNANGNIVETASQNYREISLEELNIDIRETTTGLDVEYRTTNSSGGEITETINLADKFTISENIIGQAVSNVAQELNGSNLSAEKLVNIVQELVKINQETNTIGILSKNVGAVPKSQLTAKLKG